MDIAILLYDGVTALDAIGPYEVLARLPEAKIHFVAKDLAPKRNDLGWLTLLPHYTLEDVTQPDVILIPGASASFHSVMSDKTILEWLVAAHSFSQWTTSVCTGSLILGAAGLLHGLKATTHWMAMDYLRNVGAEPTSERVVKQGKIITSAGVAAGIDMALYLVKEIAGEEFAQAAQLMIEYDPKPPFTSGTIKNASERVIKIATNNLTREAALQRNNQSIEVG